MGFRLIEIKKKRDAYSCVVFMIWSIIISTFLGLREKWILNYEIEILQFHILVVE